MLAYFIFYVQDQKASAGFYAKVLAVAPTLDVPGMTEFTLNDGSRLGLMPVAGIGKLLGAALPVGDQVENFARAELYLLVEDAAAYHQRAIQSGARELSKLLPRDWGDDAAYCLDPDNHVLAFAQPSVNAKSAPNARLSGETKEDKS